MTHVARRVDHRTLALRLGDHCYGYLVVSPRLRFVEAGRLPLATAHDYEPTYTELRVQRGLDRLPGYLPLMDVLRHLRGLVEESWAAADDLDHWASRHHLFEAEAAYRATHSGTPASAH